MACCVLVPFQSCWFVCCLLLLLLQENRCSERMIDFWGEPPRLNKKIWTSTSRVLLLRFQKHRKSSLCYYYPLFVLVWVCLSLFWQLLVSCESVKFKGIAIYTFSKNCYTSHINTHIYNDFVGFHAQTVLPERFWRFVGAIACEYRRSWLAWLPSTGWVTWKGRHQKAVLKEIHLIHLPWMSGDYQQIAWQFSGIADSREILLD